jgi:hypothetical protein
VIATATVVIRSVHERTEAWCRELVCRETPAGNVVVIHEAPFVKAVDRCFAIGIERRLPWTICVDADMLPSKGSLARLVAVAESAASNVFKVQGDWLDKFTGGVVWGGPHLYRTSLLLKAREFVPFGQVTTRPETCVLRAMLKLGCPTVQTEELGCLHGYEQFNRDIFRQMYVRARKHDKFVPYLLRRFQREARVDTDFRVAMLGIVAGLGSATLPQVDVNAFAAGEIDEWLSVWGIREKASILGPSSGEYVESVLANYKPDNEFEQVKAAFHPKPSAYAASDDGRGLAQRLRRVVSRLWRKWRSP